MKYYAERSIKAFELEDKSNNVETYVTQQLMDDIGISIEDILTDGKIHTIQYIKALETSECSFEELVKVKITALVDEEAEVLNEEMKEIADHYGYEPQSRQLQEECGELITAVNKYQRKNYDSTSYTHENLMSEIADVSIMLDQMVYLLGCEKQVTEMRKFKIERQLKRIADGE